MRTIIGSSKAYYRKIMILLWCLILGFISLFVYKAMSKLKVVKATINVSTFHVRFVHFFAMLTRTSIYKNYLFLLLQKLFFSSLPDLGAQIRCPKIGILLSKRT